MSNREKRRYPRVAAGLKVFFREQGEPAGAKQEGALENISMGGLFLTTSRTLGVGSKVEIELPLGADGEAPVRASAVVRWERSMFQPFGMGLEFTDFEDSARKRLKEWIGQLLSNVPQRVP